MSNSKVLSGRWWLTIITGLVFAYAVMEKLLNPEAISAIIAMVWISYFQRQDRKPNGG